MSYRELTINEKINIKSWIENDMPTCNRCVILWVKFYIDDLPIPLIERKDTLCDRESLLFRKNWFRNRFKIQ